MTAVTGQLLPTSPGVAPAKRRERPVPRLTAAVLLAAASRDNNLTYPARFWQPLAYPSQLTIDVDEADDVEAWAEVLGCQMQPASGSNPYVIYRAEGRWKGCCLTFRCVSPGPIDSPQPQVSRLNAAVLLAATCRDSGLRYPEEVRFSPYGRLSIYVDEPGDVVAWASTLGVHQQPAERVEDYTHYRALGVCLGYPVEVLCLVPVKEKIPQIAASTSALLDSLLAGQPSAPSSPAVSE